MDTLSSCKFLRWVLPTLRTACLMVLMTLLLGLLPLPGYAITVQDIANPRVTGGWVTDQAQVLSLDGERQLNQLLTRLEAKTQVEMAVVTVAAPVQPLTPHAFGKALFNTWGIGKVGVNNGVLLLVAVADRRIEILTGTGMGTRLPDTYLYDLIQTQIKPAFRQNHLEDGIIRGVTQISAKLTGQDPDRPLMADWVLFLMVGLGGVGLVVAGCGYGWVGWLRQQPVVLPPTGHHHQPYGFSINDLSFDRLVALTPYRVGWPRSPFILLTLGLSLFSGALAAIALQLLAQPQIADHLYARLLLIGGGCVLSTAFLYPVDCWLKRSTMNLQQIISGSLTSLILAVGLCLPAFGLVLAVQRVTWETATIADLLWTVPAYVGLWNGLIAGWFAKENTGMLRVPPQYRCQICQQPIEEMQERSRLVSLFPKLVSTTYRGWQCSTCHPTVTAAGVFLFTQEPKRYTAASSGDGRGSSSYTSYDSYDSSNTTSWDTSSGSSSSSDFGGGSTDGGGSGDSW